jgi:hypothetical protein
MWSKYMAKMTPEEKQRAHDEGMKYHQESMKHWRSWGSWFSWGSPVGLGLFFIAVGVFLWLLSQAFNF